MATAKIQLGIIRVTPEETGQLPTNPEEIRLEPGIASSPVQQSVQGPPPVPWHILFPPGHPMHGAGRG